MELFILNFMTFNFNTYSADISNTPSIITGTSTAFEDVDAKFFAANLTSCAFLGEKYDSNKLEDGTTDDTDYRAQVYLLAPNSTTKILAGFTWSNTNDVMYFGVFEFEKSATAGEDSKKINGIKIYKVSTDAVSEIRTLGTKNSPLVYEIGVFSHNIKPLFGYVYDSTDSSKVVSDFYLPPKSFFLDGKHASVTNPTITGKINAVGSDIYLFKKTASQGD